MRFTVHPVLKKIFKITMKVFLALVFLLILVILLLRIPFVQNFITDKAMSYYRERVDTPASIGGIYLDFPYNISIRQLYVEDQEADTLLYVDRIRVNTDFLALLGKKLRLDKVSVNGLNGNVYNSPDDETFNYQFIVDAFTEGASEQPEDTTSNSSFSFELGEVEITSSKGAYYDHYHGILADADIGELVAEAETFDLDSPLISIEYLSLRDTRSRVEILEANPYEEDTTASEPFYLDGEYAEILDTSVDLFVESAGMTMHTDVGTLQVDVDTLDINRQIYLGDRIVLKDSEVAIELRPTETREIESAEEDSSEPFHLVAGTRRVSFEGNAFRLTDYSSEPVEGFDPGRLDISDIGFVGRDIRMEDLFMEGELDELHALTADGPALVNGGVKMKFGPTEAYLENLLIETQDSKFAGETHLSYPDTTALYQLDERIQASLNIEECLLTMKDVYYFAPDLRTTINEPANAQLRVTGNADGRFGRLKLAGWKVAVDGADVELNSAQIRNVGDLAYADFDVPQLKFALDEKMITRLAGDSAVAGINLPGQIEGKISLSGSMRDLHADAQIISDLGTAESWIDFRLPEDSIPEYEISLRVDSLDAGRIMSDTTMGMVVAQVYANGRGFDEENLEADVIIDVPYMRFISHDFRSLCGEGVLNGYSYNGTIDYNERDVLVFQFDGLASLPSSGGQQDFELRLDIIDFQKLGLIEEMLVFAGQINADVQIPEDGRAEGYVSIPESYFVKDLKIYNLDSIGLSSELTDTLQVVTFDSRFVDMQWRTNFPLTETGDVIWRHVDHYFDSDSTDMLVGDEYFDFRLDVTDPVLFTEALVPDLEYLRMSPVTAVFDARTSELDIDVSIDSLSYLSLGLDSLGMKVTSTADEFRSNLKIRQVAQGPAIIHHTWLSAYAETGELDLMLRFRDPDRKDKYRMGAYVKREDNILKFRAKPDSLLLNYHQWAIPEDNLIQFPASGVWFENFRMTYLDKVLGVSSSINAESDTVTTVNAENIQLAELTRFNRDSASIASGLIDGMLEFTKGAGLPGITSEIRIDDLTILGEQLGLLQISSGQKEGTVYAVGMELSGEENDVDISGDYDTSGEDNIHLNAQIKPLSLKAMSIFTSNQLSEVDGEIRGNLDISGSFTSPEVNGYLSFEDASFRSTFLRSKLFVDDQRLEVNNNVFRFNQFLIEDSVQHDALIDGTVSTRDFFKYNFNLAAKTNNFTLINSKKGDNDLFYGLVQATSDITIKGNSYLPKVDLNLELTDESYITYVVPEATIQEQMQSDVVKFVDRDANNFVMMDIKGLLDTTKTYVSGIDLTATILVKPKNKLEIVIDPITGDHLVLQGEARLNLAIRPTGDINLTGRYQVNSGKYSMDFYGLVKREFNIREGSSVQWTGDPYAARLDVVAEYASRASPALPNYKSKIEFVVSLYLRGQILEPEISFGLNIAEDEPAPLQVQSWVAQLNQDEAELNKQVFGLLILNGFFDSGGTNSYDHLAENTLRSSVSSLLSGELSKLTDQIEGVELSMAIDSYEDYNKQGESIGRTQLELGVSKNLFDDRVIVRVAGNFDLEGKNSYRGDVSDFSGDIRVEYKLTEDGRYRLVGFRETNYDDLLQGEIIKTGGGFIFVRDYDALKELFRKSNDKDE